jgi:hypothetical protein
MSALDAGIGDGLYYLGILLDPNGDLIQGQTPAVASPGLWPVVNGFLRYVAHDTFEEDDDTATGQSFTLGLLRSHTLTPLDPDFIQFDPLTGEYYRASVSAETIDMALSLVYAGGAGVFNGTAQQMIDTDPTDGTSMDFYAELDDVFFGQLTASNAGEQGSYGVTLERITPPNPIEIVFDAGPDTVANVPNCEMRYFAVDFPVSALMVDGTSVGGTAVSVYVLDTQGVQVHAEEGGTNSVSFDPGGFLPGRHYIGIRETASCAAAVTLQVSTYGGA